MMTYALRRETIAVTFQCANESSTPRELGTAARNLAAKYERAYREARASGNPKTVPFLRGMAETARAFHSIARTYR